MSAGQFRDLIWPKSVRKKLKKKGLWEPVWSSATQYRSHIVVVELCVGRQFSRWGITKGGKWYTRRKSRVFLCWVGYSISKKSWGPLQAQAWALGGETRLRQRCLWRTCSSYHSFALLRTCFTAVAAEMRCCCCKQMHWDQRQMPLKRKRRVLGWLALALRTVGWGSLINALCPARPALMFKLCGPWGLWTWAGSGVC